MKLTRMLAMAGVTALLAAASVVAFAAPASAAGTTYYVNSATGSDTAAGTSPSTPWKTLAKVSATTFAPGDSILLNRGQSWAGQLHPLGSGTAGNPISIGAYGSGSRPKIDGGSLAGGYGTGAAVFLDNQQYWTIDNLEIVNNSGLDNFGGLDQPTWGEHRDGILVNNSTGTTLSGITITNNWVHNVNGCFHCNGIDAHGNGGIQVIAQGSNDSFAGVTIASNTVEALGRTGIGFWDISYYSWDNTVVDAAKLSTGVVVQDNVVKTVDSDGIVVYGSKGSMLQRNIVGNAGQKTIVGSTEPSAAGLWPTRGMDAVVQFNEVYGTLKQGTDGQGFDVDLASINTKVQYNYSHDNEGGFLLMMGGYSSNLVVRDNLSVNDGWGGEKGIFTFSYGVQENTEIYNNTVYIPSGSPAKPIFCDGCDATTPGTWSFRNNIIENHGSGDYLYPNAAGAVIDYNVFYGNHPAGEPADAHKLTTNPLLVSPGAAPYGVGSVAGFKVGSTSPAKASGTVIDDNGGRDYFGAVVGVTTAPSRGFHEAATVVEPATLADYAWDWTKTSAHSSNARIDTSAPLANMAGDQSRYARTDDSAGSITWDFTGMKNFSAKAYQFWANSSFVSWSSSTNGTTWTTVPTTKTAAVATANGWSTTTFSNTSVLPTGTRYLRANFAASTSWAVELGKVIITK